jgi:hypothetical protein
MRKDERFRELLKDVSTTKHERPHVEVEELTEIEIKTALELYRVSILKERGC